MQAIQAGLKLSRNLSTKVWAKVFANVSRNVSTKVATRVAVSLASKRSDCDHAAVVLLPSMSALSSIVSPPRTDWFGGAPLDCDSVRARLHEYVDDEADCHVPSERAMLWAVTKHVANHVASCVHCARVEAQLRAMHVAVAAVGARMRVVELPRLSSRESELAMVQRVTTDAMSHRARAITAAAGSSGSSQQRQPTPARPVLTLLSFDRSREASRERGRDGARDGAGQGSRRIRPLRRD